jgi:basic membrane lipoprotein Med (substrate-binding protein (PBP1-ABC) superfamily)
MKPILLTFTLVCIYFAGFSQDTTKTSSASKQKPKAIYQVGAAKVTVWENSGKEGIWKNFRVEKVYLKDGKWATTNSFNTKELLELKAAIDKAISEESVKVNTKKGKE